MLSKEDNVHMEITANTVMKLNRKVFALISKTEIANMEKTADILMKLLIIKITIKEEDNNQQKEEYAVTFKMENVNMVKIANMPMNYNRNKITTK
jgi:hypothetical protein